MLAYPETTAMAGAYVGGCFVPRSHSDLCPPCPFCGTPRKDDSRGHCRECGAPVTEDLRAHRRDVLVYLDAHRITAIPWADDGAS